MSLDLSKFDGMYLPDSISPYGEDTLVIGGKCYSMDSAGSSAAHFLGNLADLEEDAIGMLSNYHVSLD